MNTDQLLKKARKSGLHLWLLNKLLRYVIPFNNPHKLEVVSLGDEDIQVKLPYIRKNLNHLKGLHACALATLAEYTCGINMINVLGSKTYRLIMKDLNIKYHYQGKGDAYVKFNLDPTALASEIKAGLEKSDAVFKSFELDVYDKENHKLCTAQINWQIKPWNKVKVRV